MAPRRASGCGSPTPGPGIPEADLPRVWERFYRVEKSRDRERGGAGIGLAIVRQLVEAAGGRVGCHQRGRLDDVLAHAAGLSVIVASSGPVILLA